MTSSRGERRRLLKEVEAGTGHVFTDRGLLTQAVAHASIGAAGRRPHASRRANERLEFLGDRVLGLVVAEMLLAHFPDEPEGGLSRRHAHLVRRETLAEVAVEIGLDRWLLEAGGADAGTPTPAVLADSCEALIGAIYHDGGLEPAEAFIRLHWADLLTGLTKAPRDAKTALQEWAQARSLPLPAYSLVGRSGPMHEPLFEIEVQIADMEPARGNGATKRVAEQSAAELLLARLGGKKVT